MNYARFFSLSSNERSALVAAALLVPAIHGAIALSGARRTFLALQLLPRGKNATGPADRDAQRRIVTAREAVWTAARRGPVGGNCLSQSMALWYLLRRQGIETTLRIGVRKEEHELLAHAWLEIGGLPLNDRADVKTRYVPFEGPILPERMRWA
jgi:hypothetical protein